VRYARSHQYVQAGAGPEDNRQLFFARAPSNLLEEQLKELFGQHGQVCLLVCARAARVPVRARARARAGLGCLRLGRRT
jgi:hypothetical protein